MNTSKRPKLMLEVMFLQDQYASRGIGRYGREIVKRILEQKSEQVEVHLVGFGTLEDNINALGIKGESGDNYLYHTLGEAKLSNPLSNILLLRKVREIVSEVEPDLYFAAHFDRGVPSELTDTVVTVHDLIPYLTSKYSSKNFLVNFLKGVYYRNMLKKALAAKHIICDTRYVQKQIIENFSIEERRIDAVALGISEIFYKDDISTKLPDGIKPSSYLLYDAGFEGNKNTDRLARIFSEVSSAIPELNLVVTGGDFENKKPINERSHQFIQTCDKLGIEDKVIPVGKVSENDLVALFRNAKAYINLSSAEGFGFGPLQAMASDIPAIISNNPVFIEVSAEAALVVDPLDTTNAASQITRLLQDQESIDKLIQKGKSHVEKYSWSTTFKRTWEILSKYLNRKR